jgi:hypothetical protein
VARAGGDILPKLKQQFEKSSTQQKRVLVDILARIHSREAMQIILDVLFDPDFELVKEACQAVRRHIGDATPKQRALLHKQVAKFMNSSRVKRNDRVLTSCLLLVGNIGAPDARQLLLNFTTPRNLGYIRRNALIGLKSLEPAGAAAQATARQVLKYLADTDATIAQHALDILEKIPLSGSHDAQWRKLLKNKHAIVRSFSARKLAATDNAATNRLMMTLLDHEDAQVSEIAAGALARHKHASSSWPPWRGNAKPRRPGVWPRFSSLTANRSTGRHSGNLPRWPPATSNRAIRVTRRCFTSCATSTRKSWTACCGMSD